jgi:hypothetical protein
MADHARASKKRDAGIRSLAREAMPTGPAPQELSPLAISGVALGPGLAYGHAEAAPARPGLVVGRADDPAEHEAEAAGARVVAALRRRGMQSGGPRIQPTGPRVARAGVSGGFAGGPVSAETEQAIAGAAGRGGQPLHDSLRRPMEDVLGADFSGVRIHSGPESSGLNAEVGAQAFTVGHDIFLGGGAPDLESEAGLELLGHELTHTIQQQAAPVAPVQRKIDEAAVKAMAISLGVKKRVSAVEVPKDQAIKTTTPFSDYPAGSVMDLPAELAAKSIILLNFPDWETNPDYDDEFKGYYRTQAATAVTDGLGGGAYNHTMDLVVLREPYTEPELLHEMGHKAQNEAGINADTASVLFLEYQNVMSHQNMPWLNRKDGAEPPRLMYSSTGISTAAVNKAFKITKALQMTPEIWGEFMKQAVTALHHTHPAAKDVLKSLDVTLTGRYAEESDAKGTYANQVKFNLMAEYCTQRG